MAPSAAFVPKLSQVPPEPGDLDWLLPHATVEARDGERKRGPWRALECALHKRETRVRSLRWHGPPSVPRSDPQTRSPQNHEGRISLRMLCCGRGGNDLISASEKPVHFPVIDTLHQKPGSASFVQISCNVYFFIGLIVK